VRFRGGGSQAGLPKIDFKRRQVSTWPPSRADRNTIQRTGFMILSTRTASSASILAPQRLAAGDTVVSSEHADVKPGHMQCGREMLPIGHDRGTIVEIKSAKAANRALGG